MKPFLGYRIKTTNISGVEKALVAAKENLREAAMAEYHRLLADEICEVVDDITLGVMQRPARPIIDEATARLNDRINKAEMTSSGTEYDLRSFVSIIPDKGYTYLMLNVANPKLAEAFANTPNIENFHVTEGDTANGVLSEAAAKWGELRKRYDGLPILLSANLTNQMTVYPECLEYASPIARAKTRARRNMTSKLLNQYACGQEIKSYQLMLLMDKALTRLLDEDVQSELDEMTARLASTLIEITRELVCSDPTAPTQAPVTDEEVEEAEEEVIETNDGAEDDVAEAGAGNE